MQSINKTKTKTRMLVQKRIQTMMMMRRRRRRRMMTTATLDTMNKPLRCKTLYLTLRILEKKVPLHH
jgi:hypothetical protein